MNNSIFLFSLTFFLVLLCIMLGLYWQRQFLANVAAAWFQGRVKKAQTNTGDYRDQATASVLMRFGLYIVVPLVMWFIFSKPWVVLLALVLAYKIPRMLAAWRKKRRLASMERDLPIALAMFASALTGGVSLSVAIQTYTKESKTPLSTEFAYLLRLQRLGVEFDSALEQVSKRVGLADFELVALAMRISKAVGGNLSENLIQLSNSIQQKLLIEGKIKALTSQGVLQAWVMSLLPVLVTFALTIIQPEEMDKLFNTFTGNVVLCFCALMDYIGFKIISKILAIDV